MRQAALFQIDSSIRIKQDGQALAVYTPYSPHFVNGLKHVIPTTDRKWDPQKRAWLVSPGYGSQVQDLIRQHYRVTVELPILDGGPQAAKVKLLDVRYIGMVNQRDDGTESAYGVWRGGWNVVFPKDVLMAWFGQEQRPGEEPTLFGVLGVRPQANAAEIKKAYRRAALTWHPDTSQEPGTREQFERIQAAYEVLKDEGTRTRYAVGLELERRWRETDVRKLGNKFDSLQSGYRAPLRCGLILAEGHEILGRFIVDSILQWEDITNADGRTLVSSWPRGANMFQEVWS